MSGPAVVPRLPRICPAMRLQAPPSLRSTIVPLNKDMDHEENNWRIFSCE